MANRISLLSIIVEEAASAHIINDLLSQNGAHVIGRMGIPYKDKGISIITVVLDAPADVVSALSGKLGMLPGVSAKALSSKKEY